MATGSRTDIHKYDHAYTVCAVNEEAVITGHHQQRAPTYKKENEAFVPNDAVSLLFVYREGRKAATPDITSINHAFKILYVKVKLEKFLQHIPLEDYYECINV